MIQQGFDVSAAGRDAAYTPIDALGNSVNGAELEVGVEDMGEELLVEICNQNHEVIATNALHLSDMWEVITCRTCSTKSIAEKQVISQWRDKPKKGCLKK